MNSFLRKSNASGKISWKQKKHDHFSVRTLVKEKCNIIKTFLEIFALALTQKPVCLILIILSFASVQSHGYLLLLTDDVYSRKLQRSCLKETCGDYLVHPLP